MKFNEQPRTFLLLEDSSPPIDMVKEILESPLGLAQEIVCKLFNNDFGALRDDMDIIKEFVAGVTQAKSLSGYSVANYYSLMFSFHQWFHSSYRARQGKVLEAVLRKVLESHTSFKSTPESVKKEMIPILKDIFKTQNIPNLDIDVMGVTPNKKKVIIIQLRSRDDTGGTTAKGSLVDMLKGLLRAKKKPSTDILYLIGIWDKRNSQQRESTIKKIYSSLKENTKLSEKDFQKIDKGVSLTPQIKLQMAYGIDSILDAIFQWDTLQKSRNAEAVRDVIHKIEKWDDLWLAYAIASIEIETQSLRGMSNVRLLAEKCNELDIDLDYRSYDLLQKSIETAIQKLIPAWTEQSLPVHSPAEQALYLRDLLFLRAIYEKKCLYTNQNLKKKSKRISESAPYYQTSLFKAQLPASSKEPELVSFRQLIPEITDTTYLTHGIFYYPAKFIPQIPRFCIKEYTQENDWIIDPFAGSGTVGLEAVLNKRNSVLLDINPLINYIVPLKIQFHDDNIDKQILTKLLDEMRQSKAKFVPDWSNLEYWYDKDILSTLSKYWGWIKQQEDSSYIKIIQAALLKASKQFSYAEHKAPKLFKSKTKLVEMKDLLQKDWKEMLNVLIYETSFDIYARVKQLARYTNQRNSKTIFHGSVDSSNFSINSAVEAKAIITSPPYLQAQEYIRTSKLELYWLGHTEDEIKKISKMEIPYRKSEKIINTPTLDLLRNTLTREDLREMLDSYFYHTIHSLENAACSLTINGYLCVFVGNPKVDGLEVETWRVISEYFGQNGFDFLHIYEDQIKNRQLFKNRKNKNPDGMKSEFLLVMQKQS
jgi:cell division protein FtsL